MGKLFDKLTKKLDAKRRPYCAALVVAGCLLMAAALRALRHIAVR